MEAIAGASSEHISPVTGGDRPSKKQITDTGDKALSSSLHIVTSNDDLLIEILLRLPAISLHLFKSVSKRWLSLITDPDFTLRRSRIANIDPPSGLFLHRPKPSSGYDFVPLDSRIPAKSASDFAAKSGNIEILQSCNGLLLCCILPDNFFVYNPSINLSKMLPERHYTNFIGLIGGMKLAYDPISFPHYKVVCAEDMHDEFGSYIDVQIYSSETGNWSVSGDRFPLQCFTGFYHGVYWNNAIHWLDIVNGGLHFRLDLGHHPSLTSLPTPGTLDRIRIIMCYDYELFESCGRLLLVYTVRHCRELVVHEMRKGCSGWSLKYVVDLDEVGRLFPKSWGISGGRFCFVVRCVVVGRREEDSYVVMDVFGKVVQYHIVLRTLGVVYDLVSARDPVSVGKKFRGFPFVASLAGV